MWPGKTPVTRHIISKFIIFHLYIYIYMWSRVPCSYPPKWYGSPGSTPGPSICKLLAAFLRSSLVFASSLQHFWLPASHLLGPCYLLDDPRSTHTLSKYLRATYSHIIYTCAMYLLPIYYLCTLSTLHAFNIYRTYHTFQWYHTYDTYHTNFDHTYHTYHTCHKYHTYET